MHKAGQATGVLLAFMLFICVLSFVDNIPLFLLFGISGVTFCLSTPLY